MYEGLSGSLLLKAGSCNPARNTGSSFVGKRRRRQFTGPAVNVSGRGSRDKKSHGTVQSVPTAAVDTERRAAARAQLRIGSARRKWLEYEQSGASVAERVFRPRTCRSLRAQPEKRENESSVKRAELPGILEQSRKAQSDAADTGFDVCVTASVAPKRVCAGRTRPGGLRAASTVFIAYEPRNPGSSPTDGGSERFARLRAVLTRKQHRETGWVRSTTMATSPYGLLAAM
ncbi:uncharacterized protein PITG_01828 [Phytophthora infestans T30-4]|uniref:Uncharacterized protein n=1 Tax=Phytophthora infestans (strain T30-4) TaxID=403677 RepID=D0MU69_PHYIT|nr:uncharacterized protein PITG_01828 [Phytophthora infestans T30-4]EEY61516.1 conserved hypothetical protein [Phytophthora infestans T30-4]|eukprot:XP_002908433.1 conserved hypothetical protein [Phytophthora infestans T30-4]